MASSSLQPAAVVYRRIADKFTPTTPYRRAARETGRYRDLKEHLVYLLEPPTEGLLADELRAELTRLAASPDLTERMARIPSICETARYASHPS